MKTRNLFFYTVRLFREYKCLLLCMVTLLIVQYSIAACTCSYQQDVYFPVQKEPQTEYLTSSLSGELVIINGYLRVKDDLIIWPYGYSFKQEGGQILIYNDADQVVMKKGDFIRIGGGEIPASSAEELIGEPFPSDTVGPFWLAGEISVIKN